MRLPKSRRMHLKGIDECRRRGGGLCTQGFSFVKVPQAYIWFLFLFQWSRNRTSTTLVLLTSSSRRMKLDKRSQILRPNRHWSFYISSPKIRKRIKLSLNLALIWLLLVRTRGQWGATGVIHTSINGRRYVVARSLLRQDSSLVQSRQYVSLLSFPTAAPLWFDQIMFNILCKDIRQCACNLAPWIPTPNC